MDSSELRLRSQEPTEGEPDADPVEVAKHILLAQLSSSAKSRFELERALARKRVPPAAAQEALDRFTELGYIDDEAFARSWVQSRRRSRGLARAAVRCELQAKHITPETIEAVLLDEVDDDAELASARGLVERKLRAMSKSGGSVDVEVATRRLVAMLARKGYAPSTAYAVVRECTANL